MDDGKVTNARRSFDVFALFLSHISSREGYVANIGSGFDRFPSGGYAALFLPITHSNRLKELSLPPALGPSLQIR